jgi:tetratricopeptide (TPR) repeat protein
MAAGRPADALPLVQEVLEGFKTRLGPDHPDTLRAMNNLGGVFREAGRPAEALPLFEEVLKARRARLGPNDAATLRTMDNLALTYRDLGRLQEALPLHEEAFKGFQTQLGPEHRETLIYMSNLAAAYLASKMPEKALPLVNDYLAAQRKRWGPDHPQLAANQAQVGLMLVKSGQYAEAENVLRESLKIRESRLPDDWATFNTKALLGASLLGQRNFTEAEPLLLAGYEGMKQREGKIPAAGRIRLVEAVQRLVQLYEAWDRPEQAQAWRTRLQEERDAKGGVDQRPRPVDVVGAVQLGEQQGMQLAPDAG